MTLGNVRESGRPQGGFSMLEFLVAIGVLTVLMGALMSFMGAMQERYSSEQKVAAINQGGKTGMDLLAMDVGQAGFPPTVKTTIAQASVTGSNTAQTVTIASSSGIYDGRVVLVDVGVGTQEAVTVTQVCPQDTGCSGSANTITGVFKMSHSFGAPIQVSAIPYPQGILFSTSGSYTSDCNKLKIMGDLRADGTLRYVEYRYTPFSGNTPGVLVRSDTPASATTENPAVTVVDNLWDNSLFNYTVYSSNCTGVPACVTCTTPVLTGSFTYVIQVGVTMTMRTALAVEKGAGGARTIIFRQQYFTPRNIIDSMYLANDGLQTVLPLAPGTVTMYLGQ